MTKQEILEDMLIKHHKYVEDWHNNELWEEYKKAWKAWRAVRGE
jgi:hypothetical protein